ncbi:MAG: hypothetical protein JKY56_07720, partial [Kofleriaceae bacterium]|nr:hypothetical protein [Kofleriaceae bacterium]
RLEAIIHHGLGLRAPDRISNASEFLVDLAGLDDELNSLPDAIKSTGMVDLVTGEHAAAVGGGIASTDAARQHQPSPVTPKMKRMVAYAGVGAVIVLGIGIFSFSGGADSSDEPELLMDIDDLRAESRDNPKAFAERFAAELKILTKRVESGQGEKAIGRLKKLQAVQPKDSLVNRLLGLAYMEKRYWKDGFKYLRIAILQNSEYQDDEFIIKAALRSLTSKRRPSLGIKFLVDVIGYASIPYLEETAEKGGDRQREHASSALEQLTTPE